MKLRSLGAILLSAFLLSCDDDGDKDYGFLLEHYNTSYTQANRTRTIYTEAMPPELFNPVCCSEIEYKRGKPMRVTQKAALKWNNTEKGVLEDIDTYDEISYTNTSIEVTRDLEHHTYVFNPTTVKYKLDYAYRIVCKETSRDTTDYIYNEDDLIVKSVSRNGGYSLVTRNFIYNADKNLIRINGKIENKGGYNYDIYEYFEDYDNAPNGFKKLRCLEQAFVRSLSENNFNTYKTAMYNNEGIRVDTMGMILPVMLDGNGKPVYGECDKN